MMQEILSRLSDLERRIANAIRVATVAEIDHAAARARVAIGSAITTAWLPWITQRAGDDATWWAPSIGEQVLVLAPRGELAVAVILPAIYQQAHPAPDDVAGKWRIEFADGGWVEHDPQTGDIATYSAGRIDAEAAGDVIVEAGGNIEVIAAGTIDATAGGMATINASAAAINCDTTINGNLAVSGSVAAASANTTGDMVAGGKSLINHTHPENCDGGGITGPPL